MSTVIFFVLILATTFAFMELVAWAMHKYVMHGPMWYFHIDHHQPKPNYTFQRNDTFFLIFALPAVICILIGVRQGGLNVWVAIGAGITLYGFAYFLVHDVFIHGRFSFLRKLNSKYFKAIKRAHQAHHSHRDRHDGECFGMLWAPLKFFREVNQDRRKSR